MCRLIGMNVNSSLSWKKYRGKKSTNFHSSSLKYGYHFSSGTVESQRLRQIIFPASQNYPAILYLNPGLFSLPSPSLKSRLPHSVTQGLGVGVNTEKEYLRKESLFPPISSPISSLYVPLLIARCRVLLRSLSLLAPKSLQINTCKDTVCSYNSLNLHCEEVLELSLLTAPRSWEE